MFDLFTWSFIIDHKVVVFMIEFKRGFDMTANYKKLWKLLIDRDMKKKDLAIKSGISNTSIAKLGRNENITMDVFVKICGALKCSLDDIVEIISEDNDER